MQHYSDSFKITSAINGGGTNFLSGTVIDTLTGRTKRIPSDNLSDYQSIGWTPDGQVMALKIGLRATMWKFQPVPR